MAKNQTIDDQIKKFILDTVKNDKPENSKQLIAKVRENHTISVERINNLLIEMENEGSLHFAKHTKSSITLTKPYMRSEKVLWYWITISLAVSTATSVFVIPATDYPLVYLRSGLGIIFVLFLPGYVLVKLLFPTKLPKRLTFSNKITKVVDESNIDSIERIALSIGMSVVLAPLVSLILNYTPWGIKQTPITLSLLGLTVLLATAALVIGFQSQSRHI